MYIETIKTSKLVTKLILSLLVLFAGVTYFFTFTSAGLTLVLNAQLEDPTASISLSDVSNTFRGTTTISNLNYQSQSIDVLFSNVTMNWNPLSLFNETIVIKELRGNKLTVDFKTYNRVQHPFSHPGFPLATNVMSASIKDLIFQSNGKVFYSISETDIENIYLKDNIFADKIVMKSTTGHWIKLAGRFGFTPDSVINLTTESTFGVTKDNVAVNVKGTLVGNTAQLRFLQEVSAPVSANIIGRINHILTEPSWALDANINSSLPTGHSISKYLSNVSGDLSARGNLSQFHFTSNLQIRDTNKTTWSTVINATANDNHIKFDLDANNKSVSTISYAKIVGDLDLKHGINNSASGLQLEGNWKNVSLPIDVDSLVISESGNFTFDGENLLAVIDANGVQLDKLGPNIQNLAIRTRRGERGELSFNGSAKSDNGNLKLSGSMFQANNKYQLEKLSLIGSNFTLVRKPQAHIIVTPNLAFVRKNNIMTSTGTVTIPTANIQLHSVKNTLAMFSSMFGASNDVMSASGNVDLQFGKSVWMHGYGLNAHVTGELSLRDLSNKQIVANGELRVLRGNYSNRKQKMALSGGRLKFKNDDFDNPVLDLDIKRSAYAVGENKIVGRLQKLFYDSSTKDRKREFKATSGKVALNQAK